ncbi:MAG: hypothetical protein EOO01_00050 [Chitinophagaceae bacterium]|nr:MAG: hypothetical protein EOO01_00050 [Chitinophagaceae bacterium]
MPSFLTTINSSAHIERIISSARKEIFLISPYLQISKIFMQRLMDAAGRGVRIHIVYGKKDLKADQLDQLRGLNGVTICFLENLHAKCYFNEQDMIITSMNLYEYSEKNNREMGISVSLKHDNELFFDARNEAYSIIKHAKRIDILKSAANHKKLDFRNWKTELLLEVGTIFNDKVALGEGKEITIKSFKHNLACYFEKRRGKNNLFISKILSAKLYLHMAKSRSATKVPKNVDYILEEGGNGRYAMAYFRLVEPLETEGLNYILPTEIDVIYNFIVAFCQLAETEVVAYEKMHGYKKIQ